MAAGVRIWAWDSSLELSWPKNDGSMENGNRLEPSLESLQRIHVNILGCTIRVLQQIMRINNIKKLKKIRQMEFLRLICVMQFITIMTFPWELWKPPNQPFDSDFSIKKKGGSRRLSSPAFLDISNYSIYTQQVGKQSHVKVFG